MSESNEQRYRSLMIVSPKLYRYITDGLEEEYRIHSYDLKLLGKKVENGIEVIVRHGEYFDHEVTHFFKTEEIEEGHPSLDTFIKETGDTARKVLIDNYFKIMAP
mgnify:CR=1 FL=1